jgi:ubiquinone/menaquinone biosynthesis C-methylase UbiE
LPVTRALTEHRLRVIGVDFSAVQLARARRLVPAARLVQADMTALHLRPASLDAVVSFYALIHVPLADQQACSPASAAASTKPGAIQVGRREAHRR